jgi:hypothetical protein
VKNEKIQVRPIFLARRCAAAKIYYVGDWAVMTGPVFAETPFYHAPKGLDIFNCGKWLKQALESTGEHSVESVPTWDFYNKLGPGDHEKLLRATDVLIFSDTDARLFQLAPSFFDREKFGTKILTFPDRIRLTLEAVEPIGYNRRRTNFEKIDPRLKVAVFWQKKKKTFLLSYACHPVTLGPTKEISADWPGALIREIEGRGFRGLFFQGFCGDIDPVTYMNRRLEAGKNDLSLYGKIVAERAFKSEKYVSFEGRAEVKAAERRIRLPLQVFPKSAIERETLAALEATKEFPHAGRVVRAWRRKVEKFHARFSRSPWTEDVPVQALAVGGLKILGLPGEVFSGLGLKLRRKWPSLMPIGYANGNVGYLPTREAFRTANDYASYCAPKFYAIFPFSPEAESVLLRAGNELLSSL